MNFASTQSTSLPSAGTAILVQSGPVFTHPDLVSANARSDGRLFRAVSLSAFRGRLGEVASVAVPPGLYLDRLILVGAEGAQMSLDYRSLGARLASMPEVLDAHQITLITESHGLDIARGMALRDYRFDRHLSSRSDSSPIDVTIACVTEDIETSLSTMLIEVEATHFVRDLVNEPGNVLPPPEMARRIADAGRAAGLSVEILDEGDLRKKEFNLMLGVAQGSVHPAQVVILRLGDKNADPVALVGKGVTFDTGGVNTKSVAGMWEMKGDMAGAATIAGTMIALARTGFRSPLVAVLGLAENMTGGSAMRPGDILRSLSGKTVEVRNTDCEGRLILADCLTYAQRELRAHTLVDMATLTYAVKIGLGTRYGGIYGNRPDLVDSLRNAAAGVGELVWPMPIDAEFHAELASDFADMVNWPGVTYGNASIAAAFLEKFVEPPTRWAHIDIAGPAYGAKGTEFSPPGATGFGVELLINFLRTNYGRQGSIR